MTSKNVHKTALLMTHKKDTKMSYTTEEVLNQFPEAVLKMFAAKGYTASDFISRKFKNGDEKNLCLLGLKPAEFSRRAFFGTDIEMLVKHNVVIYYTDVLWLSYMKEN
jgi:hypothetical protein